MTDVISLPYYPQSAEGFCLAACARMMLAYWGTIKSEQEIAKVLALKEWGAPASAIERLAQWGWRVEYGQGTLESLQQWVQGQQPVIAFVRTGFLENWAADVGHAVIVVGVASEHVYIHDPALSKAPTTVSIISFEAAWTEMDYGYGLITPSCY